MKHYTIMLFLLLAGMLIVPAMPAHAVIYVDTNVVGSANNGTSWANAYQNLATALTNAANGSEIWVAKGTYTNSFTYAVTSNNVAVYGGFTNGSPWANRDWTNQPTIISGYGLSRILQVTGTGTTRVDGFIFLYGSNATASMAYSTAGAGPIEVYNSTFTSNTGIGFNLNNTAGTNVFGNCWFLTNSCSAGSCVYNVSAGLSASNCTFVSNDVGSGAIYCGGSALSNSFQNCTFNNNRSAAGGTQGAHITMGGTSTNYFSSCNFFNGYNSSGAWATRCGAIMNNTASKLVLYDCLFTNNYARCYGGGCSGGIRSLGLVHATRCTFIGNYTSDNYVNTPGAVLLIASVPGYNQFLNCSFIANTASGVSGGAAYCQGTSPSEFLNCTFFTNTSVNGCGAVMVVTGSGGAVVSNSIFYCNVGASASNIYVQASASLSLAYSDVDTNTVVAASGGQITYGLGVINTNPLFASTVPPYDVHEKSAYGRWDTNTSSWVIDTVTSLCIDSGDPANDSSLEPYPSLYLNMGAYGNTVQASKANTSPRVVNSTPTNITSSSAYLNGSLIFTGLYSSVVFLYWGPSDGVTTESSWGNTNLLGTNAAATPVAYSVDVSSLTPDTLYYYRYMATNAAGTNWASSTMSFRTIGGALQVTNGSGATSIGYTNATLNGLLVTGGAANVWIYWGTNDGGTVKSAWGNVVDMGVRNEGYSFSTNIMGLYYGVQYYYRVYASNSASTAWASASNFLVPKTPLNLSVVDGLKLWLDANDTSTLTTGDGYVVQWADKSGNGGKVNTSAGGPTYPTIGTNNMPAVHFNNTSRMTNNINYAAPVTILYVSRLTGAANQRILGGANNNWAMGFHGTYKNRAFYNGWMYQPNDTYDTIWHLYAGTIGGSGINSTIYSNGTLLAANQGGITGPNGIQLNGYQGANELSDCDISEVLIYNRILSSAELDLAGSYLADKYNLDTYYSTSCVYATSVTNILNGTAALNGTLYGSNAVYWVYAFWGTNDGGRTAANWGNTALVGVFTNASQTNFSCAVAGLVSDANHYYTFIASNAATVTWAWTSSTFRAAADWRSYRCRLPIMINGCPGETLTNFTVSIVLNTSISNFYYNQFASTNGYDLRFFDETLTYELNYENELWDTNANSYLWVQVPQLTNYTLIWAYWGNGTQTNVVPYMTNGAAWASEFKGVWHLVENETNYSAPTLSYMESTANKGTGTYSYAGTVYPPRDKEGIVAKGQQFLGNAGYYIADGINCGSACNLGTSNFTISIWVKPTSFAQWWYGWSMYYLSRGESTMKMGERDQGYSCFYGPVNTYTSSAAIFAIGKWCHVTFRRSGNTAYMYSNATIVGGPYDVTGLDLSGANTFRIGRTDDSYHKQFGGSLDELQISQVARSSNWIWATWFNQASNSAFITNGTVAGIYGAPVVINTTATNIGSSSATLNGILSVPGTSAATVWVYWDTNDWGDVLSDWGTKAALSNAVSGVSNGYPMALSVNISGLSSEKTYYYRYAASNATAYTNIAFSTIQFQTLGAVPYVNNDGGPTQVSRDSAVLNGMLTTGGAANATIYWGPADGGETTSAWANAAPMGEVLQSNLFSVSISSLTASQYFYRCYVTNVNGQAWASSSTQFLVGGSAIVYVDQSATAGANNGTSWTDAYTNLTNALKLTTSPAVFWVAKGTYKPDTNYSTNYQATFNISNHYLYGGFAGTETDTSQRDISANPTILSGALGSTNCASVVRKSTYQLRALLDGFTITGGAGSDGAGLYCSAGPMTINNCIFTNNNASTYGGAIRNDSRTVINIFSNCDFFVNTGGSSGGGAVALTGTPNCTNIFRNCSFAGNRGTGPGGAIYQNVVSGTTFIENCTFFTNLTTGNGGSIYINAGTVAASNSIFWGDSAASGSEIYNNAGNLYMGYCDIDSSRIYGSIIYFDPGIICQDPLFFGTTFPYDLHEKSMYGRWYNGGWIYTDTVFSPCIDAGNPSSYNTLEPVPNGGRINLGRYGNTTQASKSAYAPLIIANNGISSLSGASVTLNGTLVTKDATPTAVYIYYGETDGVTNKSSWSYVVTNGLNVATGGFSSAVEIVTNKFYFWRCYASNAVSQSWADFSDVFISGGITVQATDNGASEIGPDSGTFTFTRPAGATAGALTVPYQISGTSVNAYDYQEISTNVVFAAGSANATVTIMPFVDYDLGEPTETAIITLLAGSTYFIGSPDSDTVNITNNPSTGLYYVDINAGSEGNGQSWATAFKTLTNALNRGTGVFWVAKGTYTPGTAATNTFYITTNMIYGGFTNGMATLAERDSTNNLTVLSGDLGGSVYANNIVTKQTGGSAVIDGFTIRDARGVGSRGAGVSNASGRVTIKNCIFTNLYANASGGAIYSAGTAIGVTNCSFIACYVTNGSGGAVYCTGAGYNRFDSCLFMSNWAQRPSDTWGGGALVMAGTYNTNVYSNSVFIGNYTTNEAGSAYGGALRVEQASADTIIIGCTYSNNHTKTIGGACQIPANYVSVTNSTFVGNYTTNSGWGGALDVANAGLKSLSNCVFIGNYVSKPTDAWGAAVTIRTDNDTNVFRNCVFVGNYTTNEGGAGYGAAIRVESAGSASALIDCAFTNNTTKTVGGACYLPSYFVGITNCTFIGNYITNGSGGALYLVSAGLKSLSNCVFVSNWVSKPADQWGAGAVAITSEFDTNVFRNCVFVGNYTTNEGGNGFGGAIRVETATSPSTFTDCAFTNNATKTIGGACYLPGYYVSITNCSFVGNYTTNAGNCGALRIESAGLKSLSNCVFVSNWVSKPSGQWGGGAIGLLSDFNTNVFRNCVFVGNYTTNEGAGDARGGAIRSDRALSFSTLIDCSFTNNSTKSYGGACYLAGGVIGVTNCTFYFNVMTNGEGGGIYCGSSGSQSFSNCVFVSNAVGYSAGALRLAGNATLTDCNFAGNYSTNGGYGGAIQGYGPGFMQFIRCQFVSNYVSVPLNAWGGGAVVLRADFTLSEFRNCVFSGNYVTNETGANSRGGAIYIENGGSTPAIIDCVFSNHVAKDVGGAIYMPTYFAGLTNCTFYNNHTANGGYGGAIDASLAGLKSFSNCVFVSNYVSVPASTWGGGAITIRTDYDTNIFRSCVFVGNYTTNEGAGDARGGAIRIENANSYSVMTDCVFTNNFARSYAGAIFTPAMMFLTNCDFAGNSCNNGPGGAIFKQTANYSNMYVGCSFVSNWALTDGGAIYFDNVAMTNLFLNCTFLTNRAINTSGGAIRTVNAGTVLNITNCIFWGDVSGGSGSNIFNAGTLNIAYSIINTNRILNGTRNYGNGIVIADPLFASSVVPFDIHEQSQYGRWSNGSWVTDAATSPAIDIGDPSADPSLEPQPNGGRLNAGRYAGTAQASKSAGSGTFVQNEYSTNVTTASATLVGSLLFTNDSPTAVYIYYGETDAFSNKASWGFFTTNSLNVPVGRFTSTVAVAADKYYYWRSYASNATTSVWAQASNTFMTGELSIQATDDGATELGKTGAFVISRPAGAAGGPLTVNYQVSGTAANGVDYLLLSGTVVMNSGATSTTLVLSAYSDWDWAEADETVTLTLGSGNYAIGAQNTAFVTITNNPWNNIYYVDGGVADDTGNGLSWATAFKSLTNAMYKGTGAFWVASGTYKPGAVATNTFYIRTNMIYGGFTSGMSSMAQRDSTNNVTILSGNLGGGIYANNIVTKQPAGYALIDGFTIMDGQGVGTYGAGVSNALGSIAIRNCIFTNLFANANGGAIYTAGSGLGVTNCTFIWCYTTNGSGGAVYSVNAGFNSFSNCLFMSNWAQRPPANEGAGAIVIYNNYNTNEFRSCVFRDCYTTNETLGVAAGGAIYIQQASSPSMFTDCTFSNCYTKYSGGACYIPSYSAGVTNCTFTGCYTTNVGLGGAIDFVSAGLKSLSNCIFKGNYVSQPANNWGAGAISIRSTFATNIFRNCVFSGNYSTNEGASAYYGGAIKVEQASSDSTMTDCVFSNNFTRYSGGACYLPASYVSMTNCTFVNNYTTNGGLGGALTLGSGGLKSLSNCVFVSNYVINPADQWAAGAVGIQSTYATNIFRNCVFVGNYSTNDTATSIGGAIKVEQVNSDSTLVDCVFTNNRTRYSGGACWMAASFVSITNCTFVGNYTTNGGYGGALDLANAGLKSLSNCVFVSNYVVAPANVWGGGAVTIRTDYDTNIFRNCVFAGNYTTNEGANDSYGGAIRTEGANSPSTLIDCVFTNSFCKARGGAAYFEGQMSLTRCDFFGNSVTNGSGGAIFKTSANTNMLINCSFVTNWAKTDGGAIYDNNSLTSLFMNCTFFTNRANTGQGGAMKTATASTYLSVTNCIFWGDWSATGGSNIYNAGTINIGYSDLDWLRVNGGTKMFGTGLINTNPLFGSISPPYDIHVKSPFGRWQNGGWVEVDTLKSSCIDAGDPASTFVLEPSPNGNRINLGRYGNTAEASLSASKYANSGTLIIVE